MKSIVIIIPYFGQFPKQFKFWLESAYNNSTIDFIIFTDNDIETINNTRIVKMNLHELRNLIQTHFDFEISLKYPYKLCDYKGAYGLIFKEYIQNYSFWGYGDIDLIYGNIRHFITDSILTKYKVVLGFGHLTLYKNSDECVSFFKKKIKGYLYYKDVFVDNDNCKFDEYYHRGLCDMWKYEFPGSIWDEQPFDDILVPRLAFNFISVFNELASSCLIFQYTNKNLYRIYINNQNEIIKEPTLYAHFQQRGFLNIKTNNTKDYLVIPNSYISYEEITIGKLKKWGKARNAQRIIWNLKNRINNRAKLIKTNLANKIIQSE